MSFVKKSTALLAFICTLPSQIYALSDEWDRPVVRLIAEYEGFRPTVYLCDADAPTIGYGHKIETEADRKKYHGAHLTQAQAKALLISDVHEKADAPVSTYLKVDLEANQLDALTSLCFNIGGPQFSGSDVLKRVNVGEVEGAYEYFNHWRRAKGTIKHGLIKRRFTELYIFADQSLDPDDDTVPSRQWGMAPMHVTDEDWGMIGAELRRESVRFYEKYLRWSGKA